MRCGFTKVEKYCVCLFCLHFLLSFFLNKTFYYYISSKRALLKVKRYEQAKTKIKSLNSGHPEITSANTLKGHFLSEK